MKIKIWTKDLSILEGDDWNFVKQCEFCQQSFYTSQFTKYCSRECCLMKDKKNAIKRVQQSRVEKQREKDALIVLEADWLFGESAKSFKKRIANKIRETSHK